MLIKAYFSEKPEKIKYVKTSKGDIDIWLRTNIEEIEDNSGEETIIMWQADENYFRAKKNKMTYEFVENNFDKLLNYEPETIEYNKESELEKRVADLEEIITELLGGIISLND